MKRNKRTMLLVMFITFCVGNIHLLISQNLTRQAPSRIITGQVTDINGEGLCRPPNILS